MSIFRAICDWWSECHTPSYQRKLRDILEETEIEEAKSRLSDDKIASILAQADLKDAQTEIAEAKLGKGTGARKTGTKGRITRMFMLLFLLSVLLLL